jgi:hypothetical protein
VLTDPCVYFDVHRNKSAGQDTNNSYKPQTDRRMTGLNMRVPRPYATDKVVIIIEV